MIIMKSPAECKMRRIYGAASQWAILQKSVCSTVVYISGDTPLCAMPVHQQQLHDGAGLRLDFSAVLLIGQFFFSISRQHGTNSFVLIEKKAQRPVS